MKRSWGWAIVLCLSAFPVAAQTSCPPKASELCYRWSSRFVGGPVASNQPDRQGTVTVDLVIDPQGLVADCTVVRSSGNPALDAETCADLRAYAHYQPALDDAGQSTNGADSLTIEWVFHPRDEGGEPLSDEGTQ